MGSITKVEKLDKATGKTVTTYRAFIRRKGYASKSKVLPSKKQAAEWLRNNEADTGLVRITKGHGQTFQDLVDAFVEAPPTRGTKYWRPNQLEFWLGKFGQMKVGDVSRVDINTALASLQNRSTGRAAPGDKAADPKKRITPATVNRYLAALSSVLNYALAHEIIDVHPLKAGKVSKLTESKGRRRILTADEERRLLDAAGQSAWPMMQLFLRMLMTTAARKSEVLQLRWVDVHLEQSVAILPTSKNDEPRALPLVADVKVALQLAKKVRPLHSDYVFYDPAKPTKPKNVAAAWKLVRMQAGLLNDREDVLDRVVLHSTRHTAATKMLRGGANIAQAAKVTGHKTLSMLNRYTHLSAQDSVDLAEKLLAS